MLKIVHAIVFDNLKEVTGTIHHPIISRWPRCLWHYRWANPFFCKHSTRKRRMYFFTTQMNTWITLYLFWTIRVTILNQLPNTTNTKNPARWLFSLSFCKKMHFLVKYSNNIFLSIWKLILTLLNTVFFNDLIAGPVLLLFCGKMYSTYIFLSTQKVPELFVPREHSMH